jgi:antitoxin component of MazEF toxin-antitoxin module|tara:strand:+ start:11487 stop:11729 length:243 start_codon:yes stop_codon:yes gene_type:complete
MQTGKWGNGLAVHLPEALMAQLGLGVGSTLTLEVRDGALVMRPGRPSLKDMLATCALKKIARADEDRHWLGSVAAGNEEV